MPPLLLLAAFHVNYATYLGGSIDDRATAIAVDSAGSVYVTGATDSPDFPLTSSTFGSPSKDNGCAFVARLNPSATAVVWSVCMASTISDSIALDAAGNVYLLIHNSDIQSSIIKLAPGADHMIFSKSLGEYATAFTVDAAGNAYAVGSAREEFVTTPEAYQTAISPGTCYYGLIQTGTCSDAYVIKLFPDGSTAYATYLGGSGPDTARAIAVDSQGNAWITGDTVSPNFPTTPDAFQSAFHGEIDLGPLQFGEAFVAKLDPTGARLLYSTYLGGALPEAGMAVAIDRTDAAYVAGATQSRDFPVTPGALQTTYAGVTLPPTLWGSAFVTKFSSSGSVVYSTFAPGPIAKQVAVGAQGEVYIPGVATDPQTQSTAFSVIAPDGSALLHSVPVAGSIAIDPQGAVYTVASSLGYVFFPTAGVLQSTFGGGTYDATITKVDFSSPPSPFVSDIVNTASFRSGTPQFYSVFQIAPGEMITVFGSGFDSTTRLLFDGTPATMLYVQPDQINAIVPFEVVGPTTAITLQGAGQTFGAGRMDVFDAVPGIFTRDGSGKGQAAVMNEDGSLNSAANPAPRDSTISVFMTGAGRMTPSQSDGFLTPLTPPFPSIALGASCNLGQVTYAGAAPGLLAGVVQVNIRISSNAVTGATVPINVNIGNFSSGIGDDTTIAIQ